MLRVWGSGALLHQQASFTDWYDYLFLFSYMLISYVDPFYGQGTREFLLFKRFRFFPFLSREPISGIRAAYESMFEHVLYRI